MMILVSIQLVPNLTSHPEDLLQCTGHLTSKSSVLEKREQKIRVNLKGFFFLSFIIFLHLVFECIFIAQSEMKPPLLFFC